MHRSDIFAFFFAVLTQRQDIHRRYHIKLPFTDKIGEVKNNYEICKSVLEKVIPKLKKENLYEAYENVIKQQLEDGIIEKLDSKNFLAKWTNSSNHNGRTSLSFFGTEIQKQ